MTTHLFLFFFVVGGVLFEFPILFLPFFFFLLLLLFVYVGSRASFGSPFASSVLLSFDVGASIILALIHAIRGVFRVVLPGWIGWVRLGACPRDAIFVFAVSSTLVTIGRVFAVPIGGLGPSQSAACPAGGEGVLLFRMLSQLGMDVPTHVLPGVHGSFRLFQGGRTISFLDGRVAIRVPGFQRQGHHVVALHHQRVMHGRAASHALGNATHPTHRRDRTARQRTRPVHLLAHVQVSLASRPIRWRIRETRHGVAAMLPQAGVERTDRVRGGSFLGRCVPVLHRVHDLSLSLSHS